MKFANSGRRKRHSSHSPASRTLFVVAILDVSYLKSTVNLEQAGSKNTFAAKTYNLCQTDLCRRVSDWRRLTMARLTRPAEISGVSAGSFPETAAGNRAYCQTCSQSHLVYHRVRSWGQLSLFCLLMISFLQLIMERSICTQMTQLYSLLECQLMRQLLN